MGRRTVTIFTDDMTGKEAAGIQTVQLVGTDGVLYELDLAPDSLIKFEKTIEPYRERAQRKGKLSAMLAQRPKPVNGHVSPVPVQRTKPVVDREQRQAIRGWWVANVDSGDLPPVVERGRIPSAVTEAYQRHGGMPIPAKVPRKAGTVGAEFRVAETPTPESAKTPRKRVPASKVKTDEPKSVTSGARRRASAG